MEVPLVEIELTDLPKSGECHGTPGPGDDRPDVLCSLFLCVAYKMLLIKQNECNSELM